MFATQTEGCGQDLTENYHILGLNTTKTLRKYISAETGMTKLEFFSEFNLFVPERNK